MYELLNEVLSLLSWGNKYVDAIPLTLIPLGLVGVLVLSGISTMKERKDH